MEIEVRIRRAWLVKAAVQIAEFLEPERGLRLLNWAAGLARPEYRTSDRHDNGRWKPMRPLRFVRSSAADGYEFAAGLTEDGD